jgi:ABC-type sugar transport system substrate-binding protein
MKRRTLVPNAPEAGVGGNRLRRPRAALLVSGLVAMAMAVAIAGCGGASSSSSSGTASSSSAAQSSTSTTASAQALKGKRLGVSLCCSLEALQQVSDVLQGAAKASGNGLQVSVKIGDGNPQTQIQTIQSMLAQGYNAIYTTLLNGQGYNQLAAEAKAKHVVWVNFSGSAVAGATLNLTPPGLTYGFPLGVAAAKWMQAHGYSSSQVGATINTDDAVTAQRTQGFVQGVHSVLPSVHVWLAAEDNNSETAAANDGADLLQAHPAIKVLFGWSSSDALGLTEAAAQHGDTNPSTFFITTPDGITGVYQKILQNSPLQLAATIGIPFGAAAAEHYIEAGLMGKTQPQSAVARVALVTKANATLVQTQEANPLQYPARMNQTLAFSNTPMVLNGPIPKVPNPYLTIG